MCRWSSMRTFQPSQSSLRHSLTTLADRSSDTRIANEPSPQCQSVRHRMFDDAVQPGRHDFVVLTKHGIRLFHKEVHT